MIFSYLKASNSGIKAKYLILETGFAHDRLIDAIKELVLKNLAYIDWESFPNFPRLGFTLECECMSRTVQHFHVPCRYLRLYIGDVQYTFRV